MLLFRLRSILAVLLFSSVVTAMTVVAAPSPVAAATDTLVPHLLKDIVPGAGSSEAAWFVQKGTERFFVVHGSPEVHGLWKTDGTAAGTVRVKAVDTGFFAYSGSTQSAKLTLVGGTLFFQAGDASTGAELWKSDGTEAGTVLVKDIRPGTFTSQPSSFTVVGSTLFFTATTAAEGRELWKSDGTPEGTVLTRDINPGPASSNPGDLFGRVHIGVLGSSIFFPANDGNSIATTPPGNGTELWKSDGTVAGTVLVKDINPDQDTCPGELGLTGVLNSNPSWFAELGGKLLFQATHGGFRCGFGTGFGEGAELWETDGTEAGTVMVKDILPGLTGFGSPLSSSPGWLTRLGSTVVFSANGGNGTELWKTDGTAEGTVLLKDINTTGAGASSLPSKISLAGSLAFFEASDNTHGAELWKTDGTAEGTALVKDINPGTAGSNPGGQQGGVVHMGAVGSDLYFAAQTVAHGWELWKSDGTDAGTMLTRDINPGPADSNPIAFSPFPDTLFFQATEPATGTEPWVLRPNQAPVAVADSYFVDQDTPLTVPAPGVLGNDSNTDGGILSAGSASDPANGSVTLNGDGSFTYTPEAGFNGTDSFTYTVSDGQGGSSTATVMLTVLAPGTVADVKGEACAYYVNVGLFGGPQNLLGCNEPEPPSGAPRPPAPTPAPGTTVANDPSYSPHVRLPADGSGGSMTATDPDGAKAQYGPAVIHGGMWPCEDKGVDDNGDGVSGNCPSSPPPSGPQSASTSGSPASGTVTATADIGLNSPPKPVSCYPGWGPNPPSTAGCLDYGGFGPFPVQGESLHVECTATKTGVTGSTTFQNATLATRTDGGGTPLPEFTEDVPDNPPINYTRHGVISNVGDVFAVVYNQHIWNDDGSLTVNAVHMYLFGPTAVGEVVRGQVTCGTTPAPLPPPDTQAPTCGTPVVTPVGPENPTPAEPRTELIGVFDTGGLQSITNVEATNAEVSVGSSGGQHLRFVPGQTGPLAVTAVRTDPALPMAWSFDATDEAGNVVTCKGVLSPPLAVDDTYAGSQAPLVVPAPGVLANDTDADGDTLTAVSAATPANGTVVLNADGSFTYTPNEGFTGDCFTYVVRDSTGLTDTGNIRITADPGPDANGSPVACDDAYETNEGTTLTVAAPGPLANDVDPEGDPLTVDDFIIFTEQGEVIFPNADGSFEYTPPVGFSGTDTFNYTVSDGNGGTDTATVTITVKAAPVAVDDAYTMNEDTRLGVPAPGLLANDTNADGGDLAATLASTPANGTAVVHRDGSFSYTPNANFNGTDTFTYTVTNAEDVTDTGTVTITVTAVNDAPVAVDDVASTTEDSPVTVPLPGVLGNDTDAEGSTLTAGSASDPAGGSVTLNADGSYTYTPDANFNGTDTFTYTVSDGNGGTDTGAVTVTVTAVADAPVAVDDAYTTGEDDPLTVVAPGVLSNDSDAEGNTLTAGSATTPANGTVALAADGSFTYTPAAGFNGTDTFTYTVSDGALTDTATVTITVTAPDGSAFHPLPAPTRILDTRPPPNQVGPFSTPWNAGQTRDVTVTGNGVPAGADAVTLNVTVTGTTGHGFLTIWPKGEAQPLASSLNWAPGQTIPNAVTVKVGAGGMVSVANPVGSTHVIIDVVGYYDGTVGDGYTPLDPARILDSRPAPNQVGPFNTPWGGGETRQVDVTEAGVPANADAVVLNATVTGTTGHGFLTIWPSGQDQPTASSLNWAPGQTIPNAVTVKVGTGGMVSVFNHTGNAHVIFDVVGYFAPGTGHLFHPLNPARVLDTRPPPNQVGPYTTPWPAATNRDVQISGNGGVPAGAAAALLNVTVTGTTAHSFLTVWPAGGPTPTVSSLNWAPGDTIPNSVTTKLSATGAITVRNHAGTVHVIADTNGWYG